MIARDPKNLLSRETTEEKIYENLAEAAAVGLVPTADNEALNFVRTPIQSRREAFVAKKTITERVLELLPTDKYYSLVEVGLDVDAEANQRYCFLASWGIAGTKRFIKADKPPADEVTTRLAEKGYGTANDVRALSEFDPDEALENNISPILDYFVSEDGLVVSAEPYYEESTSLSKYIEKNGPLRPRQFKQVFGKDGALKAARKIDEKGVFHRDWNGKNILVRKARSGRRRGSLDLECRVTDMGLALKKDDVVDKPVSTLNTGPRRFGRDPFLDETFVGDEASGDLEQAEIYAFAMTMISSRLGSAPVMYNPAERTAEQEFKGRGKVLNEDGTLDKENHNAVIDPGYRDFRRFAEQAPAYLKQGGRVLTGFSPTIGNQELFDEILRDNGYRVRLVASEEVPADEWQSPIIYQMWEGRK